MAILPVTAATIGDIYSGAAQLLIDRELQKALDDLLDRAKEDGKSRKVMIQLTLKRLDDDQVDVRVACQAKLPAGQTGLNVAQVKAAPDGQSRLVFQQYAPDDPQQRTIDDAVGK